eukprot:2873586-Amphidinium_carterae.1
MKVQTRQLAALRGQSALLGTQPRRLVAEQFRAVLLFVTSVCDNSCQGSNGQAQKRICHDVLLLTSGLKLCGPFWGHSGERRSKGIVHCLLTIAAHVDSEWQCQLEFMPVSLSRLLREVPATRAWVLQMYANEPLQVELTFRKSVSLTAMWTGMDPRFDTSKDPRFKRIPGTAASYMLLKS